jgi:cell division protein FtsZ
MQQFLNGTGIQFPGMNTLPSIPAIPNAYQNMQSMMPQMPSGIQTSQMPSGLQPGQMGGLQMPQMPQMPAGIQMQPAYQTPPTELPPIQTVQSSVNSYHQSVEQQLAQAQQTQAPQTPNYPEHYQQPSVQPQYQAQAPVQASPSEAPQYQAPSYPAPSQPSSAVAAPHSPAPQAAAPNPSEATPSPRDVLMAKARAYKESQELKARHTAPEQLSMNVDHEQQSLEEARKMAREVLSSPFSNQNLEVPAFIRKKQGYDLNKE